ncbi:hypothetical protein C3F09_07695 [candidate division GN15 bacterium]|uniref:M48 family peptidase n=1 Tax=candidate division GN15 bacterium TaxID=2072418 RepID=A0A855X627_9BACT|nr:MAG: hypothetical protein C3F09_07695 [candidate division GN15 bacterium]
MKALFAATLVFLILCSSLSYADSVNSQPSGSTPSAADSVALQSTTEKGGATEYPLTPERQLQLRSYARFVNIWRFVQFFVSIGLLALLLFTGLSARFRDWAGVARRKFWVTWLYLAIVMVVLYLLELPFDYYRGFVVESQYGFMNQTGGEWLLDTLKSLGLGIVFGIIPMWFFYYLINRVKRWWLVFSIGAIPLMIFFIVVAPVFIMPMFNKFEPLKDKQLESEILMLANKAGISGSHVYEVDASKQSSKINAYVTGLFGTKRIVLYDTLIKGFTPDEIKFVMGHEMGHYVMHHIWWGLGMAIVFIVFMLWLTDRTIHPVITRFRTRFKFDRLGDIASLPLVLIFLSVFSFVFQPVSNGLSRYFENQSDRYGMKISGVSGETAATAFEKLSAYNLADPDPNPLVEFWFYDHPALKKRIEAVRVLAGQ